MKTEKRENVKTGNQILEFIQVRNALWFRLRQKEESLEAKTEKKEFTVEVIEPKPGEVLKEGEFITEGFYKIGVPFFVGETIRRSNTTRDKNEYFDLVLFKNSNSSEPQDCVVIGSTLLNSTSKLEVKKLVCSPLCYNSRFRTNTQLIKQVYENINKATELLSSI